MSMGSWIDNIICMGLAWCRKIYVDNMYGLNIKYVDRSTKESDKLVRICYAKLVIGDTKEYDNGIGVTLSGYFCNHTIQVIKKLLECYHARLLDHYIFTFIFE